MHRTRFTRQIHNGLKFGPQQLHCTLVAKGSHHESLISLWQAREGWDSRRGSSHSPEHSETWIGFPFRVAPPPFFAAKSWSNTKLYTTPTTG